MGASRAGHQEAEGDPIPDANTVRPDHRAKFTGQVVQKDWHNSRDGRRLVVLLCPAFRPGGHLKIRLRPLRSMALRSSLMPSSMNPKDTL